jgi:hypothetical protein
VWRSGAALNRWYGIQSSNLTSNPITLLCSSSERWVNYTEHFEHASIHVAHAKQAGLCVELLSADQARAIEPNLSPDVKGALHMPLGTCCMCMCVRALVLYVCTCAFVIFPGVLVFLLFTLLRLNVYTPTNKSIHLFTHIHSLRCQYF